MNSPARAVILPMGIVAIGCGSSSDRFDDCQGGKCDDPVQDPTTFACQGVPAAANLHDPIAEILIKAGDSCPTNFAEVLAKLDALDTKDCVGDSNGVRTTLVSDRARLLGQPEAYRTVTTRTCGGRTDHGFFFTLLGVTPQSKLSDFTFTEMMGFDPVTNLYNYYTNSSGQWNFEGTSIDALSGSLSCSTCHPGGGPIMKELDLPWVHWDSDEAPMPGAEDIFAANPALGVRTSARDLEAVMKQGHLALANARIAHFSKPASGNTGELLRPLFCQLEVNLDTATDDVDAEVKGIPVDFFLDPEFAATGEVPMTSAAYQAAITAAGQSVPGVPGATDTAFKFIFPERANIDTNYVAQLQSTGVISENFVKDVLRIDFTRPLFSDERCSLLQYAPAFKAATPDPGPADAGVGGVGVGDAGVGPDTGDCCSAHDTPGCSVDSIKMCVCAADSFCCDSNWDPTCVSLVGDQGCGAVCPAPAPGGGGGGGGVGVAPAPTNTATIAEATPEAIRLGFIENLSAASPAPGTPEQLLLDHLERVSDSATHLEAVNGFLAACAARPAAELMTDVLAVANGLRSQTSGTGIIESPSQLTETTLPLEIGVALTPDTCELVSQRTN